uniref:Uncharacterized protein n=1 Tax=Sarcophilus harrisii TaxID=9305 RepID=A0A7N4PA42_SARHA
MSPRSLLLRLPASVSPRARPAQRHMDGAFTSELSRLRESAFVHRLIQQLVGKRSYLQASNLPPPLFSFVAGKVSQRARGGDWKERGKWAPRLGPGQFALPEVASNVPPTERVTAPPFPGAQMGPRLPPPSSPGSSWERGPACRGPLSFPGFPGCAVSPGPVFKVLL